MVKILNYFKYFVSLIRLDLGFQDPATGLVEALINLYNVVSFFLVLIACMVFYLFGAILYRVIFNTKY
jgi:ABC-type dipeptide/oligopeptide/nickel transport system permease component